MKQITKITPQIFNALEVKLKSLNLDQDRVSFDRLKYILDNQVIFTPEEFAFEVFYVICVAGFK